MGTAAQDRYLINRCKTANVMELSACDMFSEKRWNVNWT